MAHTLTVLTLWLAQAIGLYCLAAGISMVVTVRRWRLVLEDMERMPGLTFAFGAFLFAVGVAILIPHHILYDWLSIAVTLIAACAVVEGLVLIAWPDLFFAIARPSTLQPKFWGIVAIVLGLILFLAGFTGRADALP